MFFSHEIPSSVSPANSISVAGIPFVRAWCPPTNCYISNPSIASHNRTTPSSLPSNNFPPGFFLISHSLKVIGKKGIQCTSRTCQMIWSSYHIINHLWCNISLILRDHCFLPKLMKRRLTRAELIIAKQYLCQFYRVINQLNNKKTHNSKCIKVYSSSPKNIS